MSFVDSDSDSDASYEEVHPKRRYKDDDAFKLHEERNVERLRTLILEHGETAKTDAELAEGEVPDICYVLKYKGLSGRKYDVCRSTSPIDVPLGDGEINKQQVSDKAKPILEIVTRVSMSYATNLVPQDDGDPFNLNVGGVEQSSMIIHSKHLINALKAVVEYYPGVGFLEDNLTIDAPYRVVYHHLAALRHYRDHQPTTHDEEYAKLTAHAIDVLVDFIEKSQPQFATEKQRHHASVPSATYDNLWMLYKPGEVVYAKFENRDWTPYIISRCGNTGKHGNERFTVHCWNLTFANKHFVRTMESFSLERFTNEAAISSLDVIPASFFCGKNNDEYPADIEARNIRLGIMTWHLVASGPSYMAYQGNLVDINTGWNSPGNAAGYMSGRVVVDCDGYSRYGMNVPGHPPGYPGRPPPRMGMGGPLPPMNQKPPVPHEPLPSFAACCGCITCRKENGGRPSIFGREFDHAKPGHDAPTSDLYYLVLTKTVSGFVLGERRWGHFNVGYLQDIKYDREAFKHLVLDDEIKLTIKALIGKYASNGKVTPWPKDFVKNKGQGRIFLLHGSPGVGKTATCESIAELAHRPLLSVTSGDLSTNPLSVEKSLEYFLQLGERYGAMVLLDEADVYLEARQPRDLARNGLVSIFLRALEYYRGVLFLTTNRVRSFDSAFTSRIHVALHYRSLTDADRSKVWENSFERLERDAAGRVHVSVATREYAYEAADVRSLAWNGREIRNALQTAVALAEAEALEDGRADRVTVTDKHLRAVVKMSRGFKNFLRRRQIQDDDVEQDDDDRLGDPACYDEIYE